MRKEATGEVFVLTDIRQVLSANAVRSLVDHLAELTGFRDRDFSAARSTDKGVFATLRMKVDADTFSFLGLNR